MICFPNAKINLGLNVIRRRPDGYHDIETVMVPVRLLRDALEFVPSGTLDRLHISGLAVPGTDQDNICFKALDLMRRDFDIPPLDIHLHKAIPMGAGLGGGSADAAFFLVALNRHFKLGLDHQALELRAAALGADCAFFIANKPAFAQGIGAQLTPLGEKLKGHHIAVVHAGIHISTAQAYAEVVPKLPAESAKQVFQERPLSEWRYHLHNDFELHAFAKHPVLEKFRDQFYQLGASFAAMTGSGSAVFGIFENPPQEEVGRHFDAPFFFGAEL